MAVVKDDHQAISHPIGHRSTRTTAVAVVKAASLGVEVVPPLDRSTRTTAVAVVKVRTGWWRWSLRGRSTRTTAVAVVKAPGQSLAHPEGAALNEDHGGRPKHAKIADRSASRHGSAPCSVVPGGWRVTVDRPGLAPRRRRGPTPDRPTRAGEAPGGDVVEEAAQRDGSVGARSGSVVNRDASASRMALAP